MKTRLRGGGWVYDVLREVYKEEVGNGKGKKEVNIDVKELVESLETWVESEWKRVKGKGSGKEKIVVGDSEEDGDSGEMDDDGGE